MALFVGFGVGDGGVAVGVGGAGVGVGDGVDAGVVTMANDCFAALPKPYNAKTPMSRTQPRIARWLFDRVPYH